MKVKHSRQKSEYIAMRGIFDMKSTFTEEVAQQITQSSSSLVGSVSQLLEDALRRMHVSFEVDHSPRSSSTYFFVLHRQKYVTTWIRIADHPLYNYDQAIAWSSQGTSKIQVGYAPWADYGLSEWYLCLEKIAQCIPCMETKRVADQIIAEEKIKRIKQPDNFLQTIKNIAAKHEDKKERHKESIARQKLDLTIRRLQLFGELVEDLAWELEIDAQRFSHENGTVFNIQGQGLPPIFMYAGNTAPATLPTGATALNTITFGWDEAMYPLRKWWKAIMAFMGRSGLKTRVESKAVLNCLIAKQKFFQLSSMARTAIT